MSTPYPDSLVLARRVIRVLIKLNLLTGGLIIALLIASVLNEAWVMRALGIRPVEFESRVFLGAQLIMVIGICTVPVVDFVSRRLLKIVDSVRIGNPFIVVNAERLRAIAWALLTLDLMHLMVGFIGSKISSVGVPLHLSWGFSLTRCLAVLMLFVLARVFEEGARMREELEGTV